MIVGRMFKIGEVAQLSGCSAESIRHYEKLGLLEPPRRVANGYRYFADAAVSRLGFIRHGRTLGLDLQTISELLALADDPDADCSVADRIATRHLAHIEERVRSLERLADQLRAVISQCRGGRVAECRIIESLYEWHGDTLDTASEPK